MFRLPCCECAQLFLHSLWERVSRWPTLSIPAPFCVFDSMPALCILLHFKTTSAGVLEQCMQRLSPLMQCVHDECCN